ncbi:MAG: hypothetical protein LBG73_04120 [Spirochaetaceae bacterium]|jgi:hypothetical protein|nr:hypothetical protein [Spirochaetaceae bacterium]
MIDTSLPTFSTRGYAISCPLEREPKLTDAKLSLPVSSSSYVYSQFKHVSGVPIPEEAEGVRGVTINRLKIIDVLIEQLSSGKNADATSTIDELVGRFKSTISPYNPSKELSGAIFDVVS